MCTSARRFNCHRCQRQVILCSHCDRGNIYCLDGCSSKARLESLRLARIKYQSSRQGKHINALRQHRYRQSQKQKVTHQGSPPTTAYAVLESAENRTLKALGMSLITSSLYCDQCHRLCDPFLRLDFLQRSHFLPLFRNRTH